MRETNPHSNATRSSEEATNYAFLGQGTVSTARDGQSGGQHHVTVQESRVPADAELPVIPTVHGDFYIPPEGAPVTISPLGNNDYAVVGAPVPAVSTPSIDPGERILSHPLSEANIRFNKDGTLDIHGDVQVTINGGTQGAITDVSVNTTTDSDGHVTDVSLNITRNNDILI